MQSSIQNIKVGHISVLRGAVNDLIPISEDTESSTIENIGPATIGTLAFSGSNAVIKNCKVARVVSDPSPFINMDHKLSEIVLNNAKVKKIEFEEFGNVQLKNHSHVFNLINGKIFVSPPNVS